MPFCSAPTTRSAMANASLILDLPAPSPESTDQLIVSRSRRPRRRWESHVGGGWMETNDDVDGGGDAASRCVCASRRHRRWVGRSVGRGYWFSAPSCTYTCALVCVCVRAWRTNTLAARRAAANPPAESRKVSPRRRRRRLLPSLPAISREQ